MLEVAADLRAEAAAIETSLNRSITTQVPVHPPPNAPSSSQPTTARDLMKKRVENALVFTGYEAKEADEVLSELPNWLIDVWERKETFQLQNYPEGYEHASTSNSTNLGIISLGGWQFPVKKWHVARCVLYAFAVNNLVTLSPKPSSLLPSLFSLIKAAIVYQGVSFVTDTAFIINRPSTDVLGLLFNMAALSASLTLTSHLSLPQLALSPHVFPFWFKSSPFMCALTSFALPAVSALSPSLTTSPVPLSLTSFFLHVNLFQTAAMMLYTPATMKPLNGLTLIFCGILSALRGVHLFNNLLFNISFSVLDFIFIREVVRFSDGYVRRARRNAAKDAKGWSSSESSESSSNSESSSCCVSSRVYEVLRLPIVASILIPLVLP